MTADTILIEAATDRGIYWAQQTLAQLVESSDGKSLPSLEITDWPAFRVRGFLHDVGRSYMSVDEIKTYPSPLEIQDQCFPLAPDRKPRLATGEQTFPATQRLNTTNGTMPDTTPLPRHTRLPNIAVNTTCC